MAIFSGVFSDLRRFGRRKKLACYTGFLVPTLEAMASTDANVREFLEHEFQSWVGKEKQILGWVVDLEDCSFKPRSSDLLSAFGAVPIPAFEIFSEEQRLMCYDTFLIPITMNIARIDSEFRRSFVEGFVNWERDMRRLLGRVGWMFY
jgi:hypothetical protein